MTCPARPRRSRSRSAASGKKRQGKQRRRAGRAPGLEREPGQEGSRCSRRAPARAAGTSRTRTTSGSPRRTRSSTLPWSPRRSRSTTGTRWRAACGRVHAAAPPAGAGEAGTVTYGPNLQAWCVFLLVMHHVPVERCAEIIDALTGTRPSDGFVHAHDRPRREGGPRGEHADPGAGHHRGRAVRRRDPDPGRPGAEDPQEVPARGLHEPADLLLPRRPVHEDLRRVRVPGPVRRRARARPLPELRRDPRRPAPAVHPAHPARPGGRRPVVPGRDLARPGDGRAPRPHPRREHRPRQGPGRRPRRRHRR